MYLDELLERAQLEQPDHPLLATFLPLVANEQELEKRAQSAWQQLAARTEPDAVALIGAAVTVLCIEQIPVEN
ncbi:hypothetical protein HUU62_01610 [Rhodoferax sp. 4810]|uniref:Uncharacterized protein n=1 Tax=Thiospirillum jenense TaxID=1653858 RepID=A0A839HBQ0_9GAMM|nr:hypothetical protein [Thiospirillum jenense]MBB1073109.1 hypothetical protein [Rhodoferax jenense]MBB1124728.1 hypothetical protein [Thiospirillum jenense]